MRGVMVRNFEEVVIAVCLKILMVTGFWLYKQHDGCRKLRMQCLAQKRILLRLESVNQQNAFTDKEMTAFYFDVSNSSN